MYINTSFTLRPSHKQDRVLMHHEIRMATVTLMACAALILVVNHVSASELPNGGINLNGYRYWNPASPFNNVAGMAGAWISTPADGSDWDDGRPIFVTADGYPTSLLSDQHARSLIFTHNGSNFPTGDYVVSWNGSGTLKLENAYLISASDHQATYRVTSPTNVGLLVDIHTTSAADPIRDITVALPGTDPTISNINSAYAADLQHYGVIRYMDWNGTNSHPVSSWADRSTPQTFHWGGKKGLPYETQIDYSNELQQDMWVTVPHLADDEYVRSLAQLIDSQLDPGLRVWVEYSNEVWNSIFGQSDYARDVLVPQYGGDISIMHAYGRRAAEVFSIFEQEISNRDSLIKVVSGQAANAWQLDQALQGVTAGGTVADVAAIAPYFKLDAADMDQLYADYLAGSVDLDGVFANLEESIDVAGNYVDANKTVADSYSVPLVAYEGGQHLLARTAQQRDDQGFVELLADINRDLRMQDMYEQLLDRWTAAGGETFVFFSDLGRWGRSGYWGLKETLADDDSPKFAAVKAFLAVVPGDYDADGDVDGADYTAWRFGYDSRTNLDADGNGDGIINAADYVVWRNHFGLNSMEEIQDTSQPVPEPISLLLAFFAGVLFVVRRLHSKEWATFLPLELLLHLQSPVGETLDESMRTRARRL